MTNIIRFPEARRASNVVDPHVGAALLEEPALHTHTVQFYESDAFLVDTVGRFLDAGLRAGDRVVAIVTEAHREGLTRALGARASRAIDAGQMVLLDAHTTLSKFLIGGMPDPDLFRDVLARLIGGTREGHPGARLRVFGEMVDMLWRDGNSRAAIRLEELWNDAGKAHSFALLCAYVMGNFYREGDAARFMEVCKNHSHVIPAESFAELEDPHARLREISLLQQRARSLENEILHRKELEVALRDALRERGHAESELLASVAREREARARAEASDAFKDVFLGILGHDLRNPLNTILTTAHLMILCEDPAHASQSRIGRILTSGLRMQRMIEQILDATRARLADGIPVDDTAEHDLVPLVARMIEELRCAHPSREIELGAEASCVAHVDPDRIEQVVSNLLGNAMAHGDPERSITVTVAARGGVTSVRVHNHGPPIDPAFMPMLFDPWKREKRNPGRSDGLGLGLYIAERIIHAHGGKIEVESSAARGTSFEVVIPRTRRG